MQAINFAVLESSSVREEPFPHLIVEGFIRPDAFETIACNFPELPGRGSHPVRELHLGNAMASLMGELQGERFEQIISHKFGLVLKGLPTLCTLRGETSASDGQIHTDSRSKVVTVLIYMNTGWSVPEGRLRILRSPDNIDDYAAEIAPANGTLVAFRRSSRSWHGHQPFVGPRKVIQFNWVASDSARLYQRVRHQLSHALKSWRKAG
jgi:hypothetical protein